MWQVKINQTTDSGRKAQYRGYIDNIINGRRPTHRQSELEIEYFYEQVGGTAQRSFKGSRQVPMGTRGSTRPDIVVSGMLEVKNYKIQNANNLIRELVRQITMRREGPYDLRQQGIILDFRGQVVPEADLLDLLNRVSNATSVPIENIQIVTW